MKIGPSLASSGPASCMEHKKGPGSIESRNRQGRIDLEDEMRVDETLGREKPPRFTSQLQAENSTYMLRDQCLAHHGEFAITELPTPYISLEQYSRRPTTSLKRVVNGISGCLAVAHEPMCVGPNAFGGDMHGGRLL